MYAEARVSYGKLIIALLANESIADFDDMIADLQDFGLCLTSVLAGVSLQAIFTSPVALSSIDILHIDQVIRSHGCVPLLGELG